MFFNLIEEISRLLSNVFNSVKDIKYSEDKRISLKSYYGNNKEINLDNLDFLNIVLKMEIVMMILMIINEDITNYAEIKETSIILFLVILVNYS